MLGIQWKITIILLLLPVTVYQVSDISQCSFHSVDTRIRFVGSNDEQETEHSEWQTVENLAKQETIATQAAGMEQKAHQRYSVY